MSQATDYWVRPRTADNIAISASQWRSLAERVFHSDYFNIVEFIKKVLQRELAKRGGLRIKFLERTEECLAKVTYDPLTLHVRVDIWSDARDHEDSFSRYVLAHECGHIVMHDDFGKAFSNPSEKRIPDSEHERSAEWQADRFADNLLMPTCIVERYNKSADIAVRCGVDVYRAEARLADVADLWERNGVPHLTQCGTCLDYQTLRIGRRIWCRQCRKTLWEAI